MTNGSMLGASFVLAIDAAASGRAEVLNVTSPVNEYASSTGGLTIGGGSTATLTIAGSPLLVSTSLAGFVETVSSDPTDYLTNTDATFGDTVTIRESSADGLTIGIAAGSVPFGSGMFAECRRRIESHDIRRSWIRGWLKLVRWLAVHKSQIDAGKRASE